MSATMHPPTDVDAYLARIRLALSDLPAEEREELLVDVEASLVEAAAEGTVPLEEQLGSPERFAQDLRLAAGLSPARPAAGEPVLRRAWRRLAPSLRALCALAPVWWVLRGYALVAAVGVLTGAHWSHRLSVLPILHSEAVTLAALAAAVGASLLLAGRAGRRALPLDALLAVGLAAVAVHVAGSPPSSSTTVVFAPPLAGLRYDGRALLNVYPYDARGRLLHDVRLYDEGGRPLSLGTAKRSIDPLRRILRTRDRRPALNAFPIRYFDPGTRRVSHPDAAPRPRVGRLRG